MLLTRTCAAAGPAPPINATITAMVVISLAVPSARWVVVDLSFPIHPRLRFAVCPSRLVPRSWVVPALILLLRRTCGCFHLDPAVRWRPRAGRYPYLPVPVDTRPLLNLLPPPRRPPRAAGVTASQPGDRLRAPLRRGWHARAPIHEPRPGARQTQHQEQGGGVRGGAASRAANASSRAAARRRAWMGASVVTFRSSATFSMNPAVPIRPAGHRGYCWRSLLCSAWP